MDKTISTYVNDLATKRSTVITTDKGKILVEILRDQQSTQPVQLVLWDEVPMTKLVKAACDRKESYRYYASISTILTDARILRYYVYEILSREILYCETGNLNPPQEYVDAAVSVYASNDGIKELPTVLLAKQYCKNHFPPLLRSNSDINAMAAELVRLRYNSIVRIIEKGRALIKKENPYIEKRLETKGGDVSKFSFEMTAVVICLHKDI